MPRYAVFALALVLTTPAAAGVLFDTNFAGPYQPVPSDPHLSGALPAGWYDNSTWAPVSIGYSKQAEAGRSFLRIDIREGFAQLSHSFPDVTSTAYFRLTLSVRGPDLLPVRIGIRQNGPPYDYFWSLTQTYPNAWRELTYWFQLEPLRDAGLYLNVTGAGVFDMAAFRIEQFSYAEAVSIFQQGGTGGPKNLVRISRFPLGLQSGWTLDRTISDGDEAQIGPDEARPGPSGAPALHIQSAAMAQLYSAPFAIPDPSSAHTFSLYVAGTASGNVVSLSDGRETGRTSFAVNSPAWQRLPLTFTPALLGRTHAIRFEIAGELWIDALQLERGLVPTDYASQNACEVSLASDSSIRAVFDDEPATLRWSVTGQTSGGVLRARVVNVYGDEALLAPVALSGAFRQDGSFLFDVFPQRPFGAHRIEAWVEDSSGQPISPANELVVYRLRRPRYWEKDAPRSPFGAHLYPTNRHIRMAKAAGVNWVRLHDAGTEYIGWYHLERRPGQWTFYDAQLERYRSHGMKILGAFATAPEWASYFDRARNAYFDRYYEPRRMEDYAAYVRTVAARYAGLIDTYDLWNEPWIPGYWAVGYDDATGQYLQSNHPQADFALLMKTAYENARAEAPGVRILGFNTNTVVDGDWAIHGPDWTGGVAAAGGLSWSDVICYHQYPTTELGFPGDEVESGYQAGIGPLLDGAGRAPRPVWLTEGSAVNGLIGSGFFHYTLPYEDFEDVFATSDRQTRFLVSALAQGVAKVFLYSMGTFVHFGGGNDWRALVAEDGFLHPSAAALSALAWRIEDTQFARIVQLVPGVTAYLFGGAGGSVAVICPRRGHAAYSLPAWRNLAIEDLFGNPLPPQALGRTSVMVAAPYSVEVLARMVADPSGSKRRFPVPGRPGPRR